MMYKNSLCYSYDLDKFLIDLGGVASDLSLYPVNLEEAGKIIVVGLFRNDVNKIYSSEKCLRKWFLNV